MNEERKKEVVMTRLRIGHTHLTHSHLMNTPNDPPAQCERCGAHQSVAQFMKECGRMRPMREKHFGNKEIQEILGNGPKSSIQKVISYLQEVNLLNKI